MVPSYNEEANTRTTTYAMIYRGNVRVAWTQRENLSIFYAPNGLRNIWLQWVDQADETDNDKFRVEPVDMLVKAFRIRVHVLGEKVTFYHAPCQYQHTASLGGPLLLDGDDALAGSVGEVQRSVASRREDVRAARKENVWGTLDTK
jgi:hypothetical protein